LEKEEEDRDSGLGGVCHHGGGGRRVYENVKDCNPELGKDSYTSISRAKKSMNETGRDVQSSNTSTRVEEPFF